MSSSDRPSHSRQNRVRVGRDFEDRAAVYLTQQGFTVDERNWRAGPKEIDIIAHKDRLVVFVEVKAARSGAFGHPAERIDRRKQQNLTAAAQRYISERDLSGCDLRFDVITFHEGRLEHFPNAFSTPAE